MSQAETTSSTLAKSVSTSKNSSQFVGFFLDEQEYAFPIQQIQEIVMPGKVTRTPQVADYVEGVSNLRGTIIPIISLRRLFGLEPRPTDEATRTVVVNVGTRTMGCVVDSVTQVIRIPQGTIQPPPEVVVGRETAYEAGFPRAMVDDVLRRVVRSQFQRRQPVIAKVSLRSVGWDFRYPRDWLS